MDIEELQDSEVEQRLEIESGLVPVDVWMAVQSQNGADVSVLEFDGTFRSIPKQAATTFGRAPRWLTRSRSGQRVAEHSEVKRRP